LLALYRARYPDKRPYLIQAEAFTDGGLRRFATHQAELKAAQSPGRVWMYQWDWPCPAYDGKFGAVHGLDVSASFHSYRDQTVGSGSASGRRMCDALAGAFVTFAWTGNPNHETLPGWAPYDPATRATMIFNDPPEPVNDPRGEIRRWWAAQAMSTTPFG
jgi:para-nitrobenzyl esterase